MCVFVSFSVSDMRETKDAKGTHSWTGVLRPSTALFRLPSVPTRGNELANSQLDPGSDCQYSVHLASFGAGCQSAATPQTDCNIMLDFCKDILMDL